MSEEVDLLGPEPLKEQVAEMIEKRIRDGRYLPRRAIPGQHALAQEFHVSRPTISEAVKILVAKGLLETRRGKGTYVTGSAPDSPQP